jgi:hypothetical protein
MATGSESGCNELSWRDPGRAPKVAAELKKALISSIASLELVKAIEESDRCLSYDAESLTDNVEIFQRPVHYRRTTGSLMRRVKGVECLHTEKQAPY